MLTSKRLYKQNSFYEHKRLINKFNKNNIFFNIFFRRRSYIVSQLMMLQPVFPNLYPVSVAVHVFTGFADISDNFRSICGIYRNFPAPGKLLAIY